ncbi:MAG: transposase family protein [Thiothrix sp.]|nr:MAG: transposase family protein [Thiothrix sp.]
MNYEALKNLSAAAFRRSVGIERALFDELVVVLAEAETAKKKSGRPSLSLANQLCLALSYWREYRTFFHLGLSFGVHESNAHRIVHRVEQRLAASGHLALVKPATRSKPVDPDQATASLPRPVVLLDASEVPIERPKKAKRRGTAVSNIGTR